MLPERLGPYRIVRKLGRGGMGMVFLGEDDAAKQTAAVKLLAGDLAMHADFRERFKSEIETLRKLNHPNIVQIFGYGEQDDQIFYAMEFVAGSSLEEQLGRGRAFQWREVAAIGIEVARALRHAHDRGVIHRDIKPGNLLLTEAGIVKLSDFGIARLFGNARLTGAGSVLGTAEFMAPEQAEGRAVDPRSDLYSLGAVLYVLLARRPLFQAKSFLEMLEKQRSERPAPLRSVAVDVPADFEQIVHRLLEKDPDRRYGTATVLERRLESMLEELTLAPAPGTLHVTVDPAPVEGSGSLPSPPVNPLAVTVAATHHAQVPLPAAAPPATTPPVEKPVAAEAGNVAPAVDAPVMRSDESPPQRTSGRFVAVRPGELDPASTEQPETTWISPQSWALMLGLVAMGVLAWYFLQPPSADALYRRIERQTAGGSADTLVQSEDDIRQFLDRYPSDSRGPALNEDLQRIELSRLEKRLDLQAKGMSPQTSLSPVQRCYIDALNTARSDPDLAIIKFQALIDLFEPRGESDPDDRCVRLARQRLKELGEQGQAQHKEQLTAIEKRLKRADELAKSDPVAAAAIRRAVIKLYQDKAWAKEVVERARAALK